jgi:hypothetical protein
MASRFHPALFASRIAALAVFWLTVAAALVLAPPAVVAQAPAPAAKPGQPLASPTLPPAPPPSWAFGDRVVVRGCLRFVVSDYRDRQSDVDNHDWIKLRAENACRTTLRNVLVEILLVDAQGKRYGGPVWVVGQGERLIPGGHREEDVALPDPDSRVAKRWALRILRADGLPKPPQPAAEKGREKK